MASYQHQPPNQMYNRSAPHMSSSIPLGQNPLPPAPYGGYSPSLSPSSPPPSSPSPPSSLSTFLTSLGIKKPGHQSHLLTWSTYLLLLLSTLLLFSSYDFSVLLTFGSLTRTFSFIILLSHLLTTKSSDGISLKTLHIYILVYAFRLISLTLHHGYLPYDKTGDWLYHWVEVGGLAAAGGCAGMVVRRFKNTYNSSLDTFGNHPPTLPPHFGILYLIVPCLLMAVLVHPQLNSSFVSDTSWAFSMYLESVAVLPQLFMFQKSPSVSLGMGNTIIFMTLSRTMDGVFWINSYHELVTSSGSTIPGIVCLGSQVLHAVLLGDFVYYYAKAVGEGGAEMVLPTRELMV
ncbi:hypothetical protein TrVE_jg13535 [Triparma verrucosa]|uniref:ER lumen protein retaining receptor n=1 Tax=Triparma verrucosa TaxID=1606542 RepID=A0A9W7KVA2_9STRA|nr:hypothetical protein TrVE_jg13535 [Triparma verrucosa]